MPNQIIAVCHIHVIILNRLNYESCFSLKAQTSQSTIVQSRSYSQLTLFCITRHIFGRFWSTHGSSKNILKSAGNLGHAQGNSKDVPFALEMKHNGYLHISKLSRVRKII